MDKNIYIWGTGKKTREYLDFGEANERLKGFVESHPTKKEYEGLPVFSPANIKGEKYAYILVLVHDCTRAIYNCALENGIDTAKMVFIDNWEWVNGDAMRHSIPQVIKPILENSCDYNEIKAEFPLLYENFIDCDICKYRLLGITRKNAFDLIDEAKIVGDKLCDEIYNEDYYRYRTFELVANEILSNDTLGNVAELGVYRGDFSRIINAKFPQKTLFLFDTFESFDVDEYKKELSKGHCEKGFYNAFKDTNESFVLERMPYKDKCIIKKGLFPNTISGIEDQTFCFVSLDVDFEESMYEGLKFFYPRVAEGGYLFVHDYYSRQLQGIRIAVERYEHDTKTHLCKVPIADAGGTLIIAKGRK